MVEKKIEKHDDRLGDLIERARKVFERSRQVIAESRRIRAETSAARHGKPPLGDEGTEMEMPA
ncbi:hypothetical protein N825_11990 [Skermanella stibiiresistens SB22]|uniref:Uncharacterized protein n=1 Tax=Skermanella stibiiresistens SB22 TaxID=1385369 RepID=W9GXH4_9PROT|nr:hypothetical protein [Skermanella stibiiresistens]EWY38524.1 hypothetical protein N825_11990 [Skermanella stibiiresistens SB22]